MIHVGVHEFPFPKLEKKGIYLGVQKHPKPAQLEN
jgi:hypothetical protein